MFGMNLFAALRQRLSAVLGVLGFSLLCCLSGALMTFVLGPAQALEAFRVSQLSQMDAQDVQSAAPGETLLFTATLTGNRPSQDGAEMVACIVQEWRVTVPSESGRGGDAPQPSGHWETLEMLAPELTVQLGGQVILLHRAAGVRLSGDLHEKMVKSDSALQAMDVDKLLPDGTRRYRGLMDGDRVTVLGKKASDGGVIPDHLFAGDRVAFEQSLRDAAKGLFSAGLCTMALSPLVLLGGLWFALFRRK